MTGLAEIETRRAAPVRRRGRITSGLSGLLLGGLLLPGLGVVGAPIHASPVVATLAVVLACGAALLTWRFGGMGTATVVTSAAAVVIGCCLIAFASYPGSGFVVAALIGLGLGPLLPRALRAAESGASSPNAPPTAAGEGSFGVKRAQRWSWWALAGAVAGVIVLVLLRWADVGLAAWALALVAMACGLVLLVNGRPGSEPVGKRMGATVSGLVVLYAGFSVFWVGSTAPTVTWFGSLRSHGPRGGNEVALTFDDGPNPPFSLEVADILDRYGVHGTFFEVGKAVAERPDVTKALVARGELVGNHSYNHGAFSYLDPRYPELGQTQDAFRDGAGICPAFFRPPHGTHTPFMSHVVTGDGMTLVTWDVSAQDWIETDSQRLAANILRKVKPGSIILLHDGIDGNIGADRSVVLNALPLILDGLEAKGLRPVTLDKLLNVPAYLSNCG